MNYYGQYQEDLYISNVIREQSLEITPLIIDLGAFDGINNSNSRHFFEQGWAGICVEATPETFLLLQENNKDFACGCINVLLAADNEMYDFRNAGISQQNRATKNNKGEIRAYTYLDVLRLTGIENRPIGICSIDLEGMDSVVLKHVLLHEHKPEILIVESHTQRERRLQLQMLIDTNYFVLNIMDMNILAIRKDIADKWIK